jgi:5-methylcytosine-specific restriction protein B
MEQPAEIPADLDTTLDMGLMNMGVAFNTGRNFGVAFLIDFAKSWKELSVAERDRLLVDPWAFKDYLFALPIFAAHSQRQALLHLVHPDSFEDIASGDHKRKIVAAFLERAGDAGEDEDRRLAAIRKSLEAESGHRINFYGTPLYDQWQPMPGASTPTDAPELKDRPIVRRAWLIRGTEGPGGASLVPRWIAESFISIGFSMAGPIEKGTSRRDIRDRIQTARPDDPLGKIGNTAGMVDHFTSDMAIDDLVVAPQGKKIYVGVITSDPQWRPTGPGEPDQTSRRREVEWANPEAPVLRSSLSDGLYSKLRALLTLTEVTQYADEIAKLARIQDEFEIPVTPRVSALPPATPEVAQATLLPQTWLQEIIDLLDRKRQVIFYGPPGTGKTFVAQRLGDLVVDAGGTYRLVQFHPSYAYEDFFEGFRPRATAGDLGVGYELVAGPLREMAEAALEDPSHPYLLIIDEINRANIAKVFGELYFLLEYREAAVSLLYSPDREFQLPENLYVIGTMNTADRSIALVDTAMRRRFYFFRFSPDTEPISSLLGRWLSAQDLGDEPARLLEALNREIDDPNFAIGPSYLMDPRINDDGELERVWTHAILPLLEEHFFGTETDVSVRFGLHALRADIRGEQSVPELIAEPEITGDAS